MNTSELSIMLPFGETEGTAPAGQEGACAQFRKVPLAYRVIATFESELPPFDAGFDAGMDETIYEAPDLGATNGRDVGFTSSSTVYWRYDAAGATHVALGTGTTSSLAPQQATKVATIANSGAFRVHPRGVVYTDGTDVYAIRAGSTTATRVGDQSLGACRGFAIDSSGSVYCRTSTSIVRWQFSGISYAAPFVLYGAGLPAGDDLAIESASGPFYLDVGTGISSVPAAGNDGGTATLTPIVTGRAQIGDFRLGTFGFGWSELGAGVFTTSSRNASAIVNESTTNAGTILGLQPEQSGTGWVALGSNGIYLVPTAGTPTLFRGGPFTGAAASSTYVVWNVASDGRVHRARRF